MRLTIIFTSRSRDALFRSSLVDLQTLFPYENQTKFQNNFRQNLKLIFRSTAKSELIAKCTISLFSKNYSVGRKLEAEIVPRKEGGSDGGKDLDNACAHRLILNSRFNTGSSRESPNDKRSRLASFVIVHILEVRN